MAFLKEIITLYTAGEVPAIESLKIGQQAINVADNKIYYRSLDGIKELAPDLNVSIDELFGIYQTPQSTQDTILQTIYSNHTTGFGYDINYNTGHTAPFSGSEIAIITNRKVIDTELIGGIEEVKYYENWEPYVYFKEFPNEGVVRLIKFRGNLSAVTEIYSSRFKTFPGLSKQFASVTRPGQTYELRIPNTAVNLKSIIIQNEGLSQESVNSILVTADSWGTEGGVIDLSDYNDMPKGYCGPLYSNAKLSGNGVVAKQRLINKKWEIKTN